MLEQFCGLFSVGVVTVIVAVSLFKLCPPINASFDEQKYLSGWGLLFWALLAGGIYFTLYVVHPHVIRPLYRSFLDQDEATTIRAVGCLMAGFFLAAFGLYLRLTLTTPDSRCTFGFILVALGIPGLGFGVYIFVQTVDGQVSADMLSEDELKESETYQPLDIAVRIAASDTCLYQDQSLAGSCQVALPKGSFAAIHTYFMTHTETTTVKLVSLNAGRFLETGWDERTNWRGYTPSKDAGSLALSFGRVYLSSSYLLSALNDLLVGSAIAYLIIWLTRGALSDYLDRMTFLFTALSVVFTYAAVGIAAISFLLINVFAMPVVMLGYFIEYRIQKWFDNHDQRKLKHAFGLLIVILCLGLGIPSLRKEIGQLRELAANYLEFRYIEEEGSTGSVNRTSFHMDQTYPELTLLQARSQ